MEKQLPQRQYKKQLIQEVISMISYKKELPESQDCWEAKDLGYYLLFKETRAEVFQRL